MKKTTILLTVLLVASVNVIAQNNTNIIKNISLKNQLLQYNNWIDTNKDGNIDTNEVLNTTYLNVGYMYDNTLDISEIVKFINITDLKLSNLNFSTIDLSIYPKLKNIWLSSCDNLRVLDLSTNKELNYVRLDLKYLTTLNTYNLTKLEYLYLGLTDVSSMKIDITTNKKLKVLNYENYDNYTLDLSNNDSLVDINVRFPNGVLIEPNNVSNVSILRLWLNKTFYDLRNYSSLKKLGIDYNYYTYHCVTVCVNDTNQFKNTVSNYVYQNGSVFSPNIKLSQTCSTTAIENDLITEINKPIKSVSYYNLMGIEVTEPQNSIVYIKRTLYVDDTVLSEKIMLTE